MKKVKDEISDIYMYQDERVWANINNNEVGYKVLENIDNIHLNIRNIQRNIQADIRNAEFHRHD